MKKTFACAFVLFMFASTTTALAGNKRFCGFIAPSAGPAGNTTIGAGAYIHKSLVDKACKKIRNKVKKGLKQAVDEETGLSLWEEHDWSTKDGNKCGHVSDFFDLPQICGKTGYMENSRTPYLIIKIGNLPFLYVVPGLQVSRGSILQYRLIQTQIGHQSL